MTPVKNFILILFITCNSIAQTVPFYESYNWEITPSYQIEESDNDMVAIKDKVVTEFIFEDQNLIEYYLEHKVLWLNSSFDLIDTTPLKSIIDFGKFLFKEKIHNK